MADPLARDRAARRAGLVVAAVVLAAGACTLNRDLVGVFYDDGLYAGIGWALSHGLGYVHPHLPGHPAAVHYPPLYPVVLAPLFGLFPVPVAGLLGKILNVALNAAAAGLVTWHAVRAELAGPDVPAWIVGAFIGAAAVTMPVLAIVAVLYSEPLFCVLVAAAVILADRPPPPDRLHPDRAALLAGTAAALALLTRSIGIAIGGGVVLFLLIVRRVPWRRAAFAAAPVAVAALGWAWWLARHNAGIDPAIQMNYGSYTDTVREAGFAVLKDSFIALPGPEGDLLLYWLRPVHLYLVFAIPALLVALYGFWLLLKRSAIGLSLVLYLAILVAWPYPGYRFHWAVLPWFALMWLAGAAALWPRRPARIPLGLVGAAMLFGFCRGEVKGFAGRWWRTAADQVTGNFSRVLPLVQTLPADAVVASDAEALVWMYTGRTTCPFYMYGYHGRDVTEPTPAEHRAYLEREGVTHIMIASFDSPSAQELERLLQAYPGWLTTVHAWPNGAAVFAVNRGR